MARDGRPVKAGAVTYKVTGLAQTLNAFRKLGASASDMRKITRPAAELVASVAKRQTPVRSGRLQKSVRGVGGRTSVHVKAGRRSGKTPTADYAAVQEYGWEGHNIEPDRYLRDARDEKLDEVMKILNDGILDYAKQHGFTVY
jgi:hypothetical protein